MIYTPYIWPMLLAFAILTAGVVYARRFRPVALYGPFSRVLALGALWALLYALSISAIDLPLRIILAHAQFMPEAFLSLAVFDLALTYSGYGQWLSRRRLAPFLLVPVASIALEWTGAFHTLFSYGYHIDLSGVVPALLFAKGLWFWVYVFYANCLILASCGLLIRAYRMRTLTFLSMLLMLTGILAPLVTNTLYNLGLSVVHGYDVAPSAMAFSGLLWGWALVSYKMFALVPVARAVVMDHIQDLVIVLEPSGRIIDFNRAAGLALGLTQRIFGLGPDALPPVWADVFASLGGSETLDQEISIGNGAERQIYDVTVSSIKDEAQRPLGRLFLFHNVTGRRSGEEKLRQFSRAVEQSPASIVITDIKGTIEYVNAKFTQVTGYLPEEAIGNNPRILKTDLTPPETYIQLWATLAAGQEWRGEFVNRKKSGEIFHELAMISSIANSNGLVTHYLAVKEDITERKMAEEAIKEANKMLQQQMDEIQELQASLREQAIRDPLTNLYNRRYLTEMLQRELARAEREGYPISLVLVDIDYFKQVNDSLGHNAGDLVLQSLAAQLVHESRVSDIVCRLGGDEFLVMLPNTSAQEAKGFSERWRSAFRDAHVIIGDTPIQITVSFGVATFPDHGKTSDEIIEAADRALYQAKAGGRDQVVSAPPQ